MIRATLHMTVPPGSETAFESAWRAVADVTRTAPGNLRQTLLRDGPHAFVITSDWATPEAFRAFERSPEQDDLTAPLRELRTSARMSVADVLHHVEGAVERATVEGEKVP